MPFDIMPLIREIYRQSDRYKIYPPAVTRLVKLLYLADIEWRKRHDGEPLANLTWRFLHFGPYAVELAEPLGGPEMEIQETQGGKQFRRFTFSEDDLSHTEVPEELSSIIGLLVKRWGDADLNSLLDYVYFDTEPMENATRGAILDFSKLAPTTTIAPPNFDEAKLKAIRARIADRARSMGLTRKGLHIRAFDAAQQAAWNEDDQPVRLDIGARVKLP
jgi:hypothetical protein